MNITLVRITNPSTTKPTFGVLKDEHGDPFAVTLERPWLDNRNSVSCIPVGVYECARVNSPKFGNTFEVTKVPGRSAILFHKGNLADDTHGCILVAESYEPMKGDAAIHDSRGGFDDFLALTKDVNQFTLRIEQH